MPRGSRTREMLASARPRCNGVFTSFAEIAGRASRSNSIAIDRGSRARLPRQRGRRAGALRERARLDARPRRRDPPARHLRPRPARLDPGTLAARLRGGRRCARERRRAPPADARADAVGARGTRGSPPLCESADLSNPRWPRPTRPDPEASRSGHACADPERGVGTALRGRSLLQSLPLRARSNLPHRDPPRLRTGAGEEPRFARPQPARSPISEPESKRQHARLLERAPYAAITESFDVDESSMGDCTSIVRTNTDLRFTRGSPFVDRGFQVPSTNDSLTLPDHEELLDMVVNDFAERVANRPGATS